MTTGTHVATLELIGPAQMEPVQLFPYDEPHRWLRPYIVRTENGNLRIVWIEETA